MKNRFFWFVFLCILAVVIWVSLGATGSDQSPPASGQGKHLAAEAPAATSTPTLEPTPTIGYLATANAAQHDANAAQSAASTAQANADAANRLLVQATVEHEANLQEQAGWTAEANRQQLLFLEWTATAMPSSYPATQTQVVQEQTKQAVIVTQMAMTIQAPTTIVMMAQAQSQAQMAPIYDWIYAFGLIAISVFLLALAGFLIHLFIKPVAAPEVKQEQSDSLRDHFGTVVSVKTAYAGYTSLKRMIIPCTPAMLTELAEGVLIGHKTLGINQWEGIQSETWTRNSYLPMRNFMLYNQFVRSAGSGALVPTSEGESFLRAWLDEGIVPPQYKFDPIPPPAKDDIAHDHDSHGENHAVGEWLTE